MSKKEQDRLEQEALKKARLLRGNAYSSETQVESNSAYTNILSRVGRPKEYVQTSQLVPAPATWNFFPKISESKMIEMIFSIMDNGLYFPIIVWEQLDGTHMILSGHNRVQAIKTIYNTYKDVDIEHLKKVHADDAAMMKRLNSFKLLDYLKVEACIYKHNEIDERKAKEIIIDTNYVQRDDSKRIITQIVANRLEYAQSRTDIRGKKMPLVAEELGMSATHVYNESVLASKIIEPIRELYYEGKLSKLDVLRFKVFSFEIQQWLIDTQLENLIPAKVKKLSANKNYSKQELADILSYELENDKEIIVKTKVPVELEDKFKKMASLWLRNQTRIDNSDKETA